MEAIALNDFRSAVGCCEDDVRFLWQDAVSVVSPRKLVEVVMTVDMPKSYLRMIIDNVTLREDPSQFPYRGKKIDLVMCDPQHLRVCQTFTQEDKCLSLLSSGLANVFSKTVGARGFTRTTAKIILGRTADGVLSIAHYIPPIVEERCDTAELALLDGVHRCYIAKGVGTNLETIFIRKVEIEFPAEVHHWRDLQLVKQKPPIEQRFFHLKPQLYRNLATAGIDG